MNKIISGPKTILFSHFGENWIRGSERCLIDLITHLDKQQFNPIVWCNSPYLAEHFQKYEIKTYQQPFTVLFGERRPRCDFASFYKLVNTGVKLVNDHGVDLIHVNSAIPNQWLHWVSRRCGIPLIVHLHSRNVLRDRIILGLHQVWHTVAVSQPIADQLINDGLSAKKITIIDNGIDNHSFDRFSPTPLRSLMPARKEWPIILSAGSLIYRKGVDLIIHSIYQLKIQGCDCTLMIAGDGDQRQSLEDLVKQLRLGDRIFFFGERSDLPSLLKGGADLFVSAAREEVFGLVLAEAGLAQLPVVAPRTGGIPRVVKDSHSGILFEPESVSALTNAIETLLQNQALAKTMGAHGRKRVLEMFTIEKNVQQFSELYGQVIREYHPLRWWQWNLYAPLRSLWQFVTNKLTR